LTIELYHSVELRICQKVGMESLRLSAVLWHTEFSCSEVVGKVHEIILSLNSERENVRRAHYSHYFGSYKQALIEASVKDIYFLSLK